MGMDTMQSRCVKDAVREVTLPQPFAVENRNHLFP
jgi:hypothetical protein